MNLTYKDYIILVILLGFTLGSMLSYYGYILYFVSDCELQDGRIEGWDSNTLWEVHKILYYSINDTAYTQNFTYELDGFYADRENELKTLNSLFPSGDYIFRICDGNIDTIMENSTSNYYLTYKMAKTLNIV